MTALKKKLTKLPTGWLFHHDMHLMVFRPRGIITKKRLDAAIKLLEQTEDEAAKPFNRFADLSKLDAIDLEFRAMFQFSLHRRLFYEKRQSVRSAIYVTSPAAAHVAKIHALLTNYSPLQVKLFDTMSKAARWLDVSVETLTLDPWATEEPPSSG